MLSSQQSHVISVKKRKEISPHVIWKSSALVNRQRRLGSIKQGDELLPRVVAGDINDAIHLVGVFIKRTAPLLGYTVVSGTNASIQSHPNQAFPGKVDKSETLCRTKFRHVNLCKEFFRDLALPLTTEYFYKCAVNLFCKI